MTRLHNRTDLIRAAHTIQLDATTIAVTIRAALDALHDNQAGYPTSSSGTGGTTSNDTPTERAALNPDPARTAHRQLANDLDTALRHLASAASICTTWTRGHQLTSADRTRLATLNTEPGCTVLARVGAWEPVYRTTNLGGLLPCEQGVSRWVYDFASRQGRLPTIDELRRHTNGQRIRVSA